MPWKNIQLAPGINTQATALLNGRGWTDCNLIRFKDGLPEVMGGWTASPDYTAVAGTPTCGMTYVTYSGSVIPVVGTTNGLYVLGNPSANIMPSGLYVATQWSLDHFGNDLIACPYQGHVYVDPSGARTTAIVLTNSPAVAGSIFVSNSAEQVICCGSTPLVGGGAFQPMLMSWCDNGNYNQWTPAPGNAAGSYPLTSGSRIVRGLAAQGQNLIFTDTSLYSMVYIGQPLIYGFQQVGANCGLVGPNAVAIVNGEAFWWSGRGFLHYNGVVQPLACPVFDWIWNYVNQTGLYRVWASVNPAFHEIRWDFPSAGSSYNDRYVIYNYLERIWYYGYGAVGSTAVGRACWLDLITSSYPWLAPQPIGVDFNGNIWYHDQLKNWQAGAGNAMPWSITTGMFDLSDGQDMMFVDLLVPDSIFNTLGYLTPQYSIQVSSTRYQNDAPTLAYGEPFTVTAVPPGSGSGSTEFIPMRVRGRQMQIQFSNAVGAVNCFWRHGALRVRVAPDGRN